MGERIQGGGGGENPAVQGEEGAKAQFGDSSLVSRTPPDSRIQEQSDSRIPDADVSCRVEQKSLPEPKSPHQILEEGVRKAFGGETDDVKLWHGLRTMPLREARGIWQTIANEVAVDCSDATGHVDVKRLEAWMEFLGNAATFRGEPYRFIPHAELVRSQMHRVCECLLTNRNDARDLLDAAVNIAVGEHGQSILATMSNGRKPPLRPAEAILTSLFAPHRQWGLPTCTINSTINAEIRNHPERLIKMYAQMLSSDQFTFPSGYTVRQQPIVDGFITVDLTNGGKGRDKIFEDIASGDPAKIARLIAAWQQEGIKYAESTDEAEKYKFEMPVHNLTDLLFVHFCQASNFGNMEIDDDSAYGTMLIYAGHRGHTEIYPSIIRVDGSNFLAGMAKLQGGAEAQLGLGHRYMRVGTRSSDEDHVENIDIAALLAYDPNNMETGKAYPIGDCNWGGHGMPWDIPRLAVRKVEGTEDGTPPTHEFGTLWYGSQFEKKNISEFRICAIDIMERDAEYWDNLDLSPVFSFSA
ncbi:MAG: hypothetical protein LBS22_03455 [Puniceicoccales bacterium]|jgi:hypothetical protein|nr:hypothetical protein [Puniceicoccales bacterium]